jgi:hypothetical protein
LPAEAHRQARLIKHEIEQTYSILIIALGNKTDMPAYKIIATVSRRSLGHCIESNNARP